MRKPGHEHTEVVVDKLCATCGQPAATYKADFGIGAYEFGGVCGVDINLQTVSECCDAPMMGNTAFDRAQLKDAP